MLLESLQYSSNNFKEKVGKNLSTLLYLFVFSFIIDISRDSIAGSTETVLILHGLFETIGTCLFYSLILNNLLGVGKLTILNFFTYLRVNILYSLFYLLGSVFFIIPGLYILTIFYFAPIIALEGKENGSYFKKSKSLVRKFPWSIFGVGITLLLLTALDFWSMGLIAEAEVATSFKYFFAAISNLVIVILDLYLFTATVYLYRKCNAVV